MGDRRNGRADDGAGGRPVRDAHRSNSALVGTSRRGLRAKHAHEGRFRGRTAIVTGGASGIGAALCRALVAAGAHVVVADLDLPGAEQVAAGLAGPGTARGARLDVTDAAAVAALVDDVVSEHGRLDLMLANAGITWGGDTELLTLDQWNAIIDVNIRGVVHCVHAAYPHLIRQGSGALVLTASMAGLTPAGLLTSYTMTKHAVVGLGLALRAEAAQHGVGVTVVCPAAVDTPILDKGEIGGFDGRYYYLDGQGVKTPLDPDVLAARVLEAVARDEALVVEPAQARAAWRLYRATPRGMGAMTARYVRRLRARQKAA